LALDDARGRDGIIHAEVGRQACPDGGEEVVFVSIWRDLESLYHWVGGSDLLDTPVLSNCSTGVFEEFGVEHYEAYDPIEAASALPDIYEPLTRPAADLDSVPRAVPNTGPVR
jgi:hypothetical protein